jgi:hypothetical protein
VLNTLHLADIDDLLEPALALFPSSSTASSSIHSSIDDLSFGIDLSPAPSMDAHSTSSVVSPKPKPASPRSQHGRVHKPQASNKRVVRTWTAHEYQLILNAREAGQNVSALARSIGMPVQTAKRIVSRFLREDVRQPRLRGGANTAFDNKAELMEALALWLRRDPCGDVSSRTAEAALTAQFGDHVPTAATVAKWLDGQLLFFNKHHGEHAGATTLEGWLHANRMRSADTIFIAELSLGVWTKLRGSTQADGLTKETVTSPATVFLAVTGAGQVVRYDVLADHSNSTAHALFALNVLSAWQQQQGNGTPCTLASPTDCLPSVTAALIGTAAKVCSVPSTLNVAAQMIAGLEAPLRRAVAASRNTSLGNTVAGALASLLA